MSQGLFSTAANMLQSALNPSLGEDEQSKQSPSHSKVTYPKRGKITIVACEPCRKRKTKCDGGRPICLQCKEKDCDCIYGIIEDERRLTFVRADRRRQEQEISQIKNILKKLKDPDMKSAMAILHRLRAGQSISELAESADIDSQNKTALILAGLSQQSSTSTDTLHDAVSAAQPGHSCPSREILNEIRQVSMDESYEILHIVRSNQDLLSTLDAIRSRSLYLPLDSPRREKPNSIEGEVSNIHNGTSRLVQEFTGYTTERLTNLEPNVSSWPLNWSWTTVTDDLQQVGQLLELYFTWQHPLFECFPEECFYQDMRAGGDTYCSSLLVNAICATASLLQDHSSAHDQCLQFFKEALKLVDQVHISSIPAIAAFSLLSHVEESRGRMSSMWLTCARSARMALDMQLHVQKSAMQQAEKAQQKVRIHSFWGAFISDQIVSFTLARIPAIPARAITVTLPPINIEVDKRPWDASGRFGSGKPGYRASAFNALASLARIMNSTLYMFFAPARRITAHRILHEYDKYLSWFSHLPAALATIRDAPPYILCLHMQYHTAVLLLFRPFLSARFIELTLAPGEICGKAANAISEAFKEHSRIYKTHGICTFQVHCLLTACTIHIINIKHNDNAAYLVAACQAFHSHAINIKWAAASLHVIDGLFHKWKISLPQDVTQALYGTRGFIPGFDFTSDGEADSYLPQSDLGMHDPLLNQPDHRTLPLATAVAELMPMQTQPYNYFFSPFPNQQLPLLNPTNYSAHTGGWADGSTGMEYMGNGWFHDFVGSQGN